MRSMTGYGEAEEPIGGGKVIVAIRALNHRHLEVRTAAGAELGPYVHEAEQLLRRKVARGRYDLSLAVAGPTPAAPALDREAVRSLYRELAELRDELCPGSPLALTAVLGALPEPFRVGAEPDAALRAAIERAVAAAVERLEAMRRAEGRALAADLGAGLASLRGLREAAVARTDGAVERLRRRLSERVGKLLAGVDLDGKGLDAGRLEAEVAILADRADVNEELVRLASHCDQLGRLLGEEDEVGRRIDFLLQELSREVNTLAAKCQDSEVSHIAVEMKTAIERMRQQAHNVM